MGSEQPYDGPPCLSCQMPTRSHCWDARCPWTVCVNKHIIRIADQHVSTADHEGRATLLSHPQADGHDDRRTAAYWDAQYPVSERPKPKGDSR